LTLLSFVRFIQTVDDRDKQNCELIIVGSGPEEETYRSIVHKNQLTQYVRFIEWMPRKELTALYQRASVFLFPSHEGAGMVVAEALSYGVPVICLDNAGPGEFIDEFSGISIEPGTVEETIHGLSTAIQSLYISPEKRHAMQVGARKRFTEHFDWNRRGDRLQQIYQRIAI
jgi:glycosyltransferase involved in cell wall biosynthesis